MDTKSLMRRAAAGDREAFERLVREVHPRLHRFAARLLGDPDAAQDAAQEALLRLWRIRSRWKPCGSVEGFLLQTVRNICLDHIRARHPTSVLNDDPQQDQAKESPAEEVQRRAQADAIRQAVQSLPEPHRTVFILSQYEEMSYVEIAEVLDCPIGTVASRKHQAIQTLRRRLWSWREGVNHE